MSFKKIAVTLITALFLVMAPSSCKTEKDERVEAARDADWLKRNGANPEQLARLTNKEVIDVYEAAQRGEHEIKVDNITIHILTMDPNIKFPESQLQSKFDDHAKDFGVFGNVNKDTLREFREAMIQHMQQPDTRVIPGWYRQTIPVTHYVNPNTGLDVMIDAQGEYLSGWKLNPTQLQNVLTRGML